MTNHKPTVDAFAFPPFTRSRRVRAEILARILRSRRPVPDETFDEIYPDAAKRVSKTHWTPVSVCLRVVELLRLERGERLLDIGAGAGKFAIIAAAVSGARVRALERDPFLTDIARETARRIGVDVDIVDGTVDEEDPACFDKVCLFNPFAERTFRPGPVVPPDRLAARAAADITRAERFLAGMRPATWVATYAGFGGEVPPAFDRTWRESHEGGELAIWFKRDPAHSLR